MDVLSKNRDVNILQKENEELKAKLKLRESEKRMAMVTLRSEVVNQYKEIIAEIRRKNDENIEKIRHEHDEYLEKRLNNVYESKRRDKALFEEKQKKLEDRLFVLEERNINLETRIDELKKDLADEEFKSQALNERLVCLIKSQEEEAVKCCLDSVIDKIANENQGNSFNFTDNFMSFSCSDIAPSTVKFDKECQCEPVLKDDKYTQERVITADASVSVECPNVTDRVNTGCQTEVLLVDSNTSYCLATADKNIQHAPLMSAVSCQVVGDVKDAFTVVSPKKCEHGVTQTSELPKTQIGVSCVVETADESTITDSCLEKTTIPSEETDKDEAIEKLQLRILELEKMVPHYCSGQQDLDNSSNLDTNQSAMDSFVGAAFDFRDNLESTRKTAKTEITLSNATAITVQSVTDLYLKQMGQRNVEVKPKPAASTIKPNKGKSLQPKQEVEDTCTDELGKVAFVSSRKKDKNRKAREQPSEVKELTKSKRKKIAKSPQPDRRSLVSPVEEETEEKKIPKYNTRSRARRKLYC